MTKFEIRVYSTDLTIMYYQGETVKDCMDWYNFWREEFEETLEKIEISPI